MLRHPINSFVVQWNWKAAVLSAAFRAPIFFITGLRHGFRLALTGAAVEAAFNAGGAGLYGAFLQKIRNARPAWLAWVLAAWTVPALIQLTENLFHHSIGTSTLKLSIIVSVVLSALSAMFNLFAMRRGNLLTGHEAESLGSDMAKMPRLVLDFLLVIPRQIKSFFRKSSGPKVEETWPETIKPWGEKSA